MWLRATCELQFEISVPTPFMMMLRPRSGAQQWISREEYRIQPMVPVIEFTDVYGNLCQRLTAQPGHLSIFTMAEVMTPDQLSGNIFRRLWINIPDELSVGHFHQAERQN